MSTEKDNDRDLVCPVPDLVIQHQSGSTGKGVIVEIDGLRTEFYIDDDLFMGDRLSRRLRAETGWFEKLTTHSPSVGTFYEDTLRALLQESLPSTARAGTGFIFDPFTRKTSKQIDILVYSDLERAPMYRKGDFVVIDPSMVLSQCEVKKSVRLSDVREIIKNTMLSNFGTYSEDPHGSNRICIFSFSSRSKTNSIFNTFVETIDSIIGNLQSKTKGGSDVTFTLTSIVFPSIYFLDRHDYITTSLQTGVNDHLHIEVTQNTAPGKDGLSSFIDAMIFSNTVKDFANRDFRTLPLVNYTKNVIINKPISLRRELSMLEIAALFQLEKDTIRNFKCNGEPPIGASFPSQTRLNELTSFKEFCQLKGLAWKILRKK